MIDTILQSWQEHFGPTAPDVVIQTPGRVNIIGEHTDYNQGFVFPGALDRYLYVFAGHSKDQHHHWIADDLNEESKSSHTLPSWAKYIEGAIQYYAPDIGPLHILISGDLPIGAGVSSSSALVCGILFALKELTGKSDTRVSIAQIASRVEREIIGVQGGIMDQYAIMLSRARHLIFLDCQTQQYEHLEVSFQDAEWMLINTKVRHQLIHSDYNQRAAECRKVVRSLQSDYPGVQSLRDVTADMLAQANLPILLLQRAQFVLAENNRVINMKAAINAHDITHAGRLLQESHEGLKTLFNVSCAELDFLAEFVNQFDGTYGGRMMGGGFGGCVLVLMQKGISNEVKKAIAPAYEKAFGFSPGFITFSLTGGAKRIG